MTKGQMMTTMMERPTTAQDATVRSFQLPASMLRDAATVAVAAGKDATIPVLTAVRIEVTAEGATFVATDRYRMAVAEVSWQEGYTATSGGVWAVSVPAKSLAAAVKGFPKSDKHGRHSEAQVWVNRTPLGVELVHDNGVTMLPAVEGDFPSWRSLMAHGEGEPTPTGSIAWNPAYMADAAKLPTTRNRPVRWTFHGSARPALCRFGDAGDVFTWRYLLMPVRLAG